MQTLNQWKKKFLENATLAFDIGKATKEYQEKIEKLEKENEALAKTLGKTTIERDWAVRWSAAQSRNEVRAKRAWTCQVKEVSLIPSSKTFQ